VSVCVGERADGRTRVHALCVVRATSFPLSSLPPPPRFSLFSFSPLARAMMHMQMCAVACMLSVLFLSRAPPLAPSLHQLPAARRHHSVASLPACSLFSPAAATANHTTHPDAPVTSSVAVPPPTHPLATPVLLGFPTPPSASSSASSMSLLFSHTPPSLLPGGRARDRPSSAYP